MEKHSTISDSTRRLGETLMIIMVVIILTGWVASNVADSSSRAQYAQKKAELVKLARILDYYYVDNGEYPNTRTSGGFCEIDKRYPGGVCLSELLRDGYYDALPISFEGGAYWYFEFDDYMAVGTELPRDISLATSNLCTLDNGYEFWCIKITK